MDEFKPGGVYKKDKRNFRLTQYQNLGSGSALKKDLSGLRRLYQNGWPSCGGHAGTMFKMIQEYYQSNNPLAFSSDYLWIEIKKRDVFPLDAGTSMNYIFKALREIGVCDYDLLPYNYTLNLQDYSSPARISPTMEDNGKPKGIAGEAYLEGKDLTIENLTQAIALNPSVILLLWIDDYFFGTNYPAFVQKKYGHFVVAVDTTEEGIKIIDSTEKDPSKADKFMPWTAFSFIRQAGTAIDLPNRFIFKNNLYFGMRNNPEVKELQKRLSMAIENQTGNFGLITFAAVQKYQRDKGIVPAHGFCGPLTRAKLNTN